MEKHGKPPVRLSWKGTTTNYLVLQRSCESCLDLLRASTTAKQVSSTYPRDFHPHCFSSQNSARAFAMTSAESTATICLWGGNPRSPETTPRDFKSKTCWDGGSVSRIFQKQLPTLKETNFPRVTCLVIWCNLFVGKWGHSFLYVPVYKRKRKIRLTDSHVQSLDENLKQLCQSTITLRGYDADP